MAIVYKTLFELRVTHEYFLTRSDGSVIFEKIAQEDRLQFLEEEFSSNKVSINEDLEFEFPETLQAYYESRYLKLIPAYSGCRVAIRVTPKILPDLSMVYEPMLPLLQEDKIIINIVRKNPDIDTYTNTRIRNACPFTYLFTNEDLFTTRTYPYLTNEIAEVDSSRNYEQGELIRDGLLIKEFYREVAGAIATDKWREVKGQAFANDRDRVLLPLRFEYSIEDTINLTEATFVLKDFHGNELVTVLKKNPDGLKSKQVLDFSAIGKPVNLRDSGSLKEQLHFLEVNGNNGYSAKHSILFSDDLLQNRPWACIMLSCSASNTDFNLLANDSYLHKRRTSTGVSLPARLFEIPVKSRLVYFRYWSDKGKELNPGAAISAYVRKEDKALVTNNPRPIAKAWFKLRKEGFSDTEYIPNPGNYSLKISNDQRFFYDLTVPKSELFQELP